MQIWKNNCNTAEDSTISFLLFCLFPFRLCSKQLLLTQNHPQNFCITWPSVSLAFWQYSSLRLSPPVQKLLAFISWWDVPGAGGGLRLTRSSCWVFTLVARGCSLKLVLQLWRNHVACTLQLGSSLVSTSLSNALAPGPNCSSAGGGQARCVAVSSVHAPLLPVFLFSSHQEGDFMEYHFLVVPVGRKTPKWELFTSKVKSYIPAKIICIWFEIYLVLEYLG